jgi:hypothetical protein
MHFEIAVIAVSLARQQALDLALFAFLAQGRQAGFGFGDDRLVAFGIAEFDQFDRLVEFMLDAAIAFDRAFQLVALAQQGLRRVGVIPELGVFRESVQFGETAVCDIPVKDASSAGPTTFVCRRPPPAFRRA